MQSYRVLSPDHREFGDEKTGTGPMLGGLDPSRSVTKGSAMSADTSTFDEVSIPDDARLVRLCREVFDAQGIEIGKRVIAWAMTTQGGPTVTIETGAHRICVWNRLDDAVRTLDTFIDGPYNRFPVLAG